MTPSVRISPPMLVWLLLAAVTTLPYARAALEPPAGHRFLGVFFQVEDIHNYFGYVQQASEGAFLFRNKLVLDPHPGALINVEWWITGQISGVLGGRHALAFRILGLLATLALVIGVDRLLVFAGLPATTGWPRCSGSSAPAVWAACATSLSTFSPGVPSISSPAFSLSSRC